MDGARASWATVVRLLRAIVRWTAATYWHRRYHRAVRLLREADRLRARADKLVAEASAIVVRIDAARAGAS